MTAPKRIRWQCPTGEHPGELGSRRPARDALIRYCLPCSQRHGVLVLREAPALARERQAAAERRKVKAQRARETAARRRARQLAAETARFTVDGVDLRDELARLCKLRAFGGRAGHLAKQPPRFTVTRRRRRPTHEMGYADPWTRVVHLCLWDGITLAEARELLVHELTHIHVGARRSDTHRWHGETFRTTMRRAFHEAYGVHGQWADHSYFGRFAAALVRHERAAAPT